MQGFHEVRSNESRLRVVFAEEAVSFGFPANATLNDIADCVAVIAGFHSGGVVAVNVKMPAGLNSIIPKGACHGTH